MTQAVQTAQLGNTNPAWRNRIINGGMTIDQRNAGASITPTVDGIYSLDRWQVSLSQASKYSVQQNAGSVATPAGFTNYLGITSLSSYSSGASDYFFLGQAVEGFNSADLKWGTADAKTVTLSFWVRSSLTGTFGGSLQNSAQNRSYPFTYTISSANTWTQISITIAGDTSGTWIGATNGAGIRLNFNLGTGTTYSGTAGAWAGSNYVSATGATSVVGTNGATFYITGVQLEVGTAATSFEFRDYGRELMMCQRYYYKNICTSGGNQETPLTPMGWSYSTTLTYVPVIFPTPMRATPTLSVSGCRSYNPALGGTNLTAASIYSATPLACNVGTTVASGLTMNAGYWISPTTVATDYVAFSAEL